MQVQVRRGSRWRLIVAITCLLLATVSLTPVQAVAQQATPAASPAAGNLPQFGIYPVGNGAHGYFEMTLKPGETGHFTVGIANSGKAAAALRVFAANVVSPPNGGFVAGSEEDKATAPTTWLSLPPTSFTLAPGATQEFGFSITVPTDATPGQHVTALVVRTSDALPIPGTATFKQIIRSAVSVMITVPGPTRPGFTLGQPVFDTNAAVRSLDVPLKNTGNILVKPAGTLTVTTPDGKPAISAPIQMGSAYAGLATKVQVVLPDQMAPGDYVVSVKLKDAKTGATAEVTGAKATLAAPNQATPGPAFTVSSVSAKPNGSPVRYAEVAATITNNGATIPTAKVTLNVKRDGQDVETYDLAQNQALPHGPTTISQRYIPADGWQKGTYTFQLVVIAVDNGTETVLATVDVPDRVVVG